MITTSIKSIDTELLYDCTKITVVLPNSERMKALEMLNNVSIQDDAEYDLDIQKHYKGRSLNANSYLRVLERKIADKSGESLAEVHNDMICRYGQFLQDDDGDLLYVPVKASTDVRGREDMHLNPTGKFFEKNGKRYQWHEIMKPTHLYNTKEMAILIDGVIDEAKNLQIEVLPPDELKRMKGVAE